MWYVLQVRTGTESEIQTQCQSLISDSVLEQCFIPTYEEKRKIRGEWKLVQRTLFPGYLFVGTGQPEELYKSLHRVIGMTKMLRTGDTIVPLTKEEGRFLQEFGGIEQVVVMSEGVIEGDEVRVHSGPLKGREGLIRKIDRHKRVAWLELPMFGRIQQVRVGLEIVEKREKNNCKTEEAGEP